MKALVTGASSGIGREISKILSRIGCDLILVSRNEKELKKLANELKTNTKIIAMDLSDIDNCKKLYRRVKKDDIDILINNAGFGLFGKFSETKLNKELEMIDLNIKAVHTLTKLFLTDMKAKDYGFILNVSSLAAFQAGPLMATYYATKAYVLRLTNAIKEELRRENSNVSISVLCPGPVKTNFNKIADVEFDLRLLSSNYVAKYAIDNMFARKTIIIPGMHMKMACFFTRLLPTNLLLRITYNIQRRKRSNL